jgi:hypothetical protein
MSISNEMLQSPYFTPLCGDIQPSCFTLPINSTYEHKQTPPRQHVRRGCTERRPPRRAVRALSVRLPSERSAVLSERYQLLARRWQDGKEMSWEVSQHRSATWLYFRLAETDSPGRDTLRTSGDKPLCQDALQTSVTSDRTFLPGWPPLETAPSTIWKTTNGQVVPQQDTLQSSNLQRIRSESKRKM